MNLGKDELDLTDLERSGETNALAKYLAKDRRHLKGQDRVSGGALTALVEAMRAGDKRYHGFHTFGLEECRKAHECGISLDAQFVRSLQEKFDANGYSPRESLFDDDFLNIVMHIRRGDVWDAVLAGSEEQQHTTKLVTEQYYVDLLERLKESFDGRSKPVSFHIFSDGQPKDFPKFTFENERDAYVVLNSGVTIENCRFHLRTDTMESLYHMIKASVFFPGKSTFSVLATILNRSYVIYDDEIFGFYQYDLLKQYVDANPNFVRLAELAERSDMITSLLSKANDCESRLTRSEDLLVGPDKRATLR